MALCPDCGCVHRRPVCPVCSRTASGAAGARGAPAYLMAPRGAAPPIPAPARPLVHVPAGPVARPAPPTASPAAPGLSAGGLGYGRQVVEGRVTAVGTPPGQMKAPRGWKYGSILLAAVALLPLTLCLIGLAIGLRIVLAMTGIPIGGGGCLQLLLLRGVFQGSEEKIPVHNYELVSGTRRIPVRQEGDFREGMISVGHEVKLVGRNRGNTLVVTSGTNKTLDADLRFPVNGWKVSFFLLLGFYLVVVGYGLLTLPPPL